MPPKNISPKPEGPGSKRLPRARKANPVSDSDKRKRGACPARSRGGQPGNANALKHGFYARSFKKREQEIFSSLPIEDLRGEIDLTRVSNRRILQAIHDQDLSFDQILAGARAISIGTALIASINRTRLHASFAASEAHEMEKWLQDLLKGADDEGGQAGVPVKTD